MKFWGVSRFLYLFILTVSVLGCGKRPTLYVDPQLEPYVVQFVDEVERLGYAIPTTAISVRFDDVASSSLYATCVTSDDEATINVNPERWPVPADLQPRISEYFSLVDNGEDVPDALYEDVRRAVLDAEYVIFHELMHCSFNRGHDVDPNSLLYAYFVEVDDHDDLVARLGRALN